MPDKEQEVRGLFGYRIHVMFPNMTRRQALQSLMNKYGSIRGIHRATGIPLVSLSRWCSRVGVYNVMYRAQGLQFVDIIRKIIKLKPHGKSMKKRLLLLRKEEGSWNRVAKLLRTDSKRLVRYRKFLGMVTHQEEGIRKGESIKDERWNEYEQYYGG